MSGFWKLYYCYISKFFDHLLLTRILKGEKLILPCKNTEENISINMLYHTDAVPFFYPRFATRLMKKNQSKRLILGMRIWQLHYPAKKQHHIFRSLKLCFETKSLRKMLNLLYKDELFLSIIPIAFNEDLEGEIGLPFHWNGKLSSSHLGFHLSNF